MKQGDIIPVGCVFSFMDSYFIKIGPENGLRINADPEMFPFRSTWDEVWAYRGFVPLELLD